MKLRRLYSPDSGWTRTDILHLWRLYRYFSVSTDSLHKGVDCSHSSGTTAHLSPLLSGIKCDRYVHFVLFRDAITLFFSGIMMTIRVSAIYENSSRRVIQVGLGTICLAQFGVYMWLVATMTGPCIVNTNLQTCNSQISSSTTFLSAGW